MVTTEAVLLSLLAAEVCGRTVPEEVKAALSPEMLQTVYHLSRKHDLAHLAGQAVSKLMLPDCEALTKCKQAAMKAVYRYVRLNHAYQQICQTLETAKIPFIPLKGAVIREYYPEPWMRTSSDIDILVHEEDVRRAIETLTEILLYQYSDKHFYEYSLFSPSGVHLESHCKTIEKVESKACEGVLETVWDSAYPDAGCEYKNVMTDEMFYFYHIVHMAKHFEHGGCGIRPFLDLWILNHRRKNNKQKREELLSQGGLTKFAEAAEKLSEVWFSQEESDPLSKQISAYILGGGLFGSMENMIAVSRAKKEGQLSYIFYRLFPPYSDLKIQFPVLQKHKWLIPVYVIVRWCRLILRGGMKRSFKELKTNAYVSQEQITSVSELLKQLWQK